MCSPARRGVHRKSSRRSIRLSKSRLDVLVAEAVVDAYNGAEQAMGFLTMIEDNLKLPFETEILGMNVKVERVDISEDDAIVAVWRRGKERLRVSILDITLPRPLPGAEWIAAYRYWRTGRR